MNEFSPGAKPGEFMYTSKEAIVSKPAFRGHLAPVTTLRVPSVAAVLLNDDVFRELGPAPRRGRIGTAGEFVVIGIMDYLDAFERGDAEVQVASVADPDEDLAVVQMHAAKDLLPTTKNELAMGRAYLVTEQAIKMLPKQNTLKDKKAHKKKYDMRRSERLNAMWGKVFGVSKTTLRSYAQALGAPPEVRRLFLAGHMFLDDLLDVVDAGAEVARRVERELLAGGAVVDVLKRHLGGDEAGANSGDEPGQNKEAVVGLVKSLNRWSKLFVRSEKKRPKLSREQDRALQNAEEFLAWLRQEAG